MRDEPFTVNYLSAKDGYLYFSDYWAKRLSSLSSSSPVLRVDYRNGKRAYFSWNPQPLNINDNSVVRVNATYAQKLGIRDGEKVTISFYSHVNSVSKVFVSPMSSEDFEILAMNQDLLQSGLLDQIQIVWPRQTFVAWVGTSMHVVLYVDSLEPSTEVGRLQLLTEIIVNAPSEKNAQGDLVTESCYKETHESTDPSVIQEDVSLQKTGSVVSFIWDSVQGISSRLWRKEELEKNNSGRNVSVLFDNTKLIEPVVYRVHPYHFNVESDICPSLLQPYNAFVHRKNLPVLIAHHGHNLIVNIVPILSVSKPSLSGNEDEKKVIGREGGHNFGVTSVYVKLCVIEELSEHQYSVRKHEVEKAFKQTRQKCIYLSRTVRSALHVKIGTRVKLEIQAQPFKPYSTELELTSVGTTRVPNDLDIQWRNHISKLCKTNEVLINSGGIFPIQLTGNTLLYTLVKLIDPSIPYCLLTKQSLEKSKMKISFVKCPGILIPEPDDLIFQFTEIHHSFSHLEKEITYGMTNLEMTLGLTYVPWPSKESSVSIVNTLIMGRPGSGVSTLGKHLCNVLQGPPWFVHSVELLCRNIKGKKVENLHKVINQALTECALHNPAILLLHDLDALLATTSHDQEVSAQENSYYMRVGEMIVELLEEFQQAYRIAVIATAASSAKLNSTIMAARGQHTFLSVLQIPDLSKDDRLKVLETLVEKKVSLKKSRLDLNIFAQKSDGYVVQDVVDFVEKAVFEAWKRKGNDSEAAPLLENEDLEKAFQLTQPLGLRGVDLIQDAGLTWTDIGGLEDAKKLLVEMLEWPVQFPELFAQAPLRLQSGLLLYGAPGTGKTLLAGAVAKECGLNFISVKGPELLSKYIGASEEAVRTIFMKAQSAKPCVLFFDEFDSLAPRRGHDSTGVTDRVVNQLLTQLDGVESLNSVWVLAATSRPDLLDPALLRPGRLDRAVVCPLPSEEDRLAILRSLSRKMCLADDVILAPLARASIGFTGADLQAVLYSAQLAAVEQVSPLEIPDRENSSHKLESPSNEHIGPVQVTQEHLLAALKDTRPSLSSTERQKYEIIYQNFEKSRTSSSPEVRQLTTLNQKVTLA